VKLAPGGAPPATPAKEGASPEGDGVLMEERTALPIGFGNRVIASRVVAILIPGSAPIRRFKSESARAGRLANATHGRKCRAMVLLDSGHLVLSAVHPDTLCRRLETLPDEEEPAAGRVVSSRVVSVLVAGSSSMHRLRGEAGKAGRLVDITGGRKCRSIMLLDSGAVVLSPVHPDTLCQRLESLNGQLQDSRQETQPAP